MQAGKKKSNYMLHTFYTVLPTGKPRGHFSLPMCFIVKRENS